MGVGGASQGGLGIGCGHRRKASAAQEYPPVAHRETTQWCSRRLALHDRSMHADTGWEDKADYLIACHGDGAIEALVRRISDAVLRSDDQAVGSLDQVLQLVEQRVEQFWAVPLREGEFQAFRAAIAGV